MLAFLSGRDADARKMAAMVLGLIGKCRHAEALSDRLHDDDEMVHQMAEHALWSIWFRCGTDAANAEVRQGVADLNNDKLHDAIEHFSAAIKLDPTFAEAYNQRAIARYLLEEFEASAEDCVRTVARMPSHFGAWAGMGHCYAHLHRCCDALPCYERALAINPRLAGVFDTVEKLKALAART